MMLRLRFFAGVLFSRSRLCRVFRMVVNVWYLRPSSLAAPVTLPSVSSKAYPMSLASNSFTALKRLKFRPRNGIPAIRLITILEHAQGRSRFGISSSSIMRARERDESSALRRTLPDRFLLVSKLQHVARLATKNPANLFQGGEVDAHGPAFLQTPQGRVADARLLRQPVESPPALFQ